MSEEAGALYENMPRHVRHITPKARKRVDKWRTDAEPEGYSTGLATLDEAMFRLLPNELVILAAAPSMGKTAMAMQFVRSVAEHLQASNDPGIVLVYSCEMTADDLLLRMAASDAGVNLQAARMKRCTDDEYDRLDFALKKIDALPIVINDSTSPDTAKIDAEIEAKRAMRPVAQPVRLVAIDYLELVSDSTVGAREREDVKIASIARRMKAIAKRWGIPVLLLSQITREAQNENDTKLPLISQLRGSAAIEAAADKIVFLLRPQFYLNQGRSCACELASDATDTIYVNIPKDRSGIGGLTWRLHWSHYRTTASDYKDSSIKRQVKMLVVRTPSEVGKGD